MNKWQYKTCTFSTVRPDKTVAEAMNMEGEEGWEAFHLIVNADTYVVWFKRLAPK
jgi:hypothetical protein